MRGSRNNAPATGTLGPTFSGNEPSAQLPPVGVPTASTTATWREEAASPATVTNVPADSIQESADEHLQGPQTLTVDQLRKLAELIAVEKAVWPPQLNHDQQVQLTHLVRRHRREQLMRLIACAIARRLVRAPATNEGLRQSSNAVGRGARPEPKEVQHD